MSKNNSIYIWRILFTYVIAFYHLDNAYRSYSGGWYIGVEFFFIVSGFLLCNKVMQDKENFYPLKYTLKRWLSFLPVYWFSALLMIVYEAKINGDIINWRWFWGLKRYFFDFLKLELWTGSISANTVGWYLCALLSGTLILSLVLKYANEKAIKIACPIIAFFVYASLILSGGSFDIMPDTLYFGTYYTNYAFILRGLAGMCLGVLCWYISQKINIKKCSFAYETVIIAAILGITYQYGRDWKDIIWVILISAVVLLGFKDNLSITENKIIRFADKLTLHIYLIHYVVKLVWSNHFVYTLSNAIMYLIAITVVGLVSYLITNPICKRINKIKALN